MLKRLSALLLTALLLPMIVYAQSSEQDALDDVAEYIRANPDKIGIACQVVGDPDNTYFVNADDTFLLASTAKIIILAEYARQVAAGDLDPETVVSLETLNTFYLPFMDGGAHPAWIRTLGEGAEGATLHQVASGMIEFVSCQYGTGSHAGVATSNNDVGRYGKNDMERCGICCASFDL